MRAREAGRRYTHPSDTLPMPLLTQCGYTPLELASTDEVKAAFAAVSEEEEMANDRLSDWGLEEEAEEASESDEDTG